MAGTYVSVKPFPITCGMLYDEFHRFLRSNMEPISGMHVTLITSKQNIPEAKQFVQPDRKFQGTLRKLKWWAGHDKAGYLVIEVDSPELQQRHRTWIHLGGKHSFPEYNPHITLATGLQHRQIKHLLDSYNSDPDGLGLPCAFSRESASDLKGY